MTDRDIRDVIVRAFEGVLEREGVRRSRAHAVALEQAAIVEAHGVRLVRPAHLHDPVADWRRKPQPGDYHAGPNAVRAALNGTGICPLCRHEHALTGSGTLADHTTPDTDGAEIGCLGAGLQPLDHDRTPST